MNHIKKFLAVAVISAIVVSLPLSFAPAHAQGNGGTLASFIGNPRVSWITRGVGADDLDVPLLVKYVGTSASGKVEVTVTTGDITFTSGASGSEAADTSLECPVSGALGGIIDVSNAACDTMGEVADIINASTNWRAVILDGVRADSSNAALVTMAATAANRPDGLELKRDTSQIFLSRVLVAPPEARKMTFYLKDRSTLIENPFQQLTTVLFNHQSVSTYGSGTSNIEYYCSLVSHKAAGAETTTSYVTPAGATTVASSLNYPFGMGCPVGWRLVSAVTNSAAMSSSKHYVGGIQF